MVKEHFRRLHPCPELLRRTICHQLFEARILFLAVLAEDLADKLRRFKQRDCLIDVTRKVSHPVGCRLIFFQALPFKAGLEHGVQHEVGVGIGGD